MQVIKHICVLILVYIYIYKKKLQFSSVKLIKLLGLKRLFLQINTIFSNGSI